MEPRKIIKFGNSSFVITLPPSWMEKNNLQKGDTLTVCEKKDSIVLQIPREKEERKATLEYSNQPLKLLNKELLSFYLKNCKVIEIKGENVLEKLEEIRRFKEKISSVEITEISKEKIVLKDLTSPAELDLHKLISEIIEMEKLFFDELATTNVGDKISFITQLDLNVNKLAFLAHKSINYQLDVWENPEIIKGAINYWRIIGSLEAIGDILKRIARYLKNETQNHNDQISVITKSLKEYFSFITSLLNGTTNFNKNLELYLDKKQSLLREIEQMREYLEKDINLFLVISQLFKDVIGKLDTIVISIIDLKLK